MRRSKVAMQVYDSKKQLTILVAGDHKRRVAASRTLKQIVDYFGYLHHIAIESGGEANDELRRLRFAEEKNESVA